MPSFNINAVHSASFFSTKIQLPQSRSALTRRPILLDLVRKGLQGKVSIISAPAGYGKSTLLAQALEQYPHPCAWINLDKEENDPIRFWHLFFMAIRQIAPLLISQSTELLHYVNENDWAPLIASISQELQKADSPLLIVFDDFHVIHHPQILYMIDLLIRQTPDTIHFVISSRSIPDLKIGKLRALGQVMEMDESNLRFTGEEVAAFYKTAFDIHLTSQQLTNILKHTEGWIAGLYLVGMVISKSETPDAIISNVNGNLHFIAEYLIEEVLQQLTMEQQEFLLYTSVLERFTAKICAVLTHVEDAQELIKQLFHQNAFLISLDAERHWFRYHHLFADMLRAQLERRHPGLAKQLHKKASEWYESHGAPFEAIHHALAGEVWDKAAMLLFAYAPHAMKNHELATLDNWLDFFPEETLKNHLHLLIIRAWLQTLNGKTEQAEHIIAPIEVRFSHKKNEQDHSQEILWVEWMTIRAFLAMLRNNVEDSLRHIEQITLRSSLQSRFFQYGFLLNPGEAYFLRSQMAQRGELRKAFRLFSQLRMLYKGSGLAILGYGSVVLGELYYEWNDEASLQYFIPRGLELGRNHRQIGVLVPMYLLHARYFVARKMMKEAWDVLREFELTIQEYESHAHWRAILEAFKIRLWIAEGQKDNVMAWLEQSKFSSQQEITPYQEFELITWARANGFLSRWKVAEDLLTRLVRFAEAESRLASLIEVLLLKAIAANELDKTNEAFTYLNRAIRLAYPENYQRTFLDEGIPLFQLMMQWLHSKDQYTLTTSEREYAELLISLFIKEHPVQAVPANAPPQDSLLTRRELDVLELMATGLSNAEIAERLILSIGTVKSYAHQIIDKLEVKNRTQAIVEARKKGLLR